MGGRPTRPLTETERLDWLRLIRSENVGPITFYHLLRYYGSAAAALGALPELSRRGGRRRPVKLCPARDAEREAAAVAQAGARLVAALEPDYPEALAAIEDAPPVISVRGDPALLARGTVGIVGARNASANGRRLASAIAAGLGGAELTVASGMARGIDTAAHDGALATGTAAILAGGVDVCYPAENQGLYDAIVERGVVLAEQPVGTEPQGRHFPRRNRLISGVALGVLVVEAAPRSGSLITARMALEQGREVFAVPGSPLDPRCHGTNNLIRQGATLTESADDILRTLAAQLGAPRQAAATGYPGHFQLSEAAAGDGSPADDDLARARGEIVESLGAAPTGVDEIVRRCHMSPALVAAVLLELELAGRLDRHPGNRISLAGRA